MLVTWSQEAVDRIRRRKTQREARRRLRALLADSSSLQGSRAGIVNATPYRADPGALGQFSSSGQLVLGQAEAAVQVVYLAAHEVRDLRGAAAS
jgi:hypothetical protein